MSCADHLHAGGLLHSSFKELLCFLALARYIIIVMLFCDMKFSLSSCSGERQDRPFEAQPSVMLLKLFNIYTYFTYEIVIRRTEDKEAWIKPFGKTLFIDDSQLNVNKVNALGTVDVLWRRAFGPWKSLLVPKDSQLNFNMYQPEQTPWQKL